MDSKYYDFLKRNVEFAKDCEYLIRRKLNPETEKDLEIEQRSGYKLDNYMSDISMSLYGFKENFFKSIGKNPFENNIEDYKEEALKYLEGSSPFCFNIDIHNMFGNEALRGLDTLIFYAMSLGADSEEIKNIISVLENQKLKRVNGNINRQGAEFINSKTVNIDDIEGSSVERYSCRNMYEAFCLLDDKNITRYIEYIAKSGALSGNNRVFDGIAIDQDVEGNLLVSEGNHRVFSYKLMQAVREYVTGEKMEGIQLDSSICKLKYKAVIDDENPKRVADSEIEFLY